MELVGRAIELYDWNITLCESLYSILSYFEVILRNICNNKLIEKFSKNWYLNIKLLQGNNPEKGEWAINKINETIKKIQKRKREKNININYLTNGDIISNLEFGFWSNLFCANYEHKIWRPCLIHIFHTYTRKDIYKKLDLIRDLRNRIFHYEPIIFDKQLLYKYNIINEILNNIVEGDINIHINKNNIFLENYDLYKKTWAVL